MNEKIYKEDSVEKRVSLTQKAAGDLLLHVQLDLFALSFIFTVLTGMDCFPVFFNYVFNNIWCICCFTLAIVVVTLVLAKMSGALVVLQGKIS